VRSTGDNVPVGLGKTIGGIGGTADVEDGAGVGVADGTGAGEAARRVDGAGRGVVRGADVGRAVLDAGLGTAVVVADDGCAEDDGAAGEVAAEDVVGAGCAARRLGAGVGDTDDVTVGDGDAPAESLVEDDDGDGVGVSAEAAGIHSPATTTHATAVSSADLRAGFTARRAVIGATCAGMSERAIAAHDRQLGLRDYRSLL
jgi:hypothetical protein